MKSNSPHNRRLTLERMEDRRVMAGVVQAAMYGGNLVLTGDWAQNEIAIYQGSYANEVVVSGIDTGKGPTRVNDTLSPVVLQGFTGSILGNMNSGSDKVLIANINVPRSVVLNTHKGNDQVFFSNSYAFLRGTLNNGAAFPSGETIVNDSLVLNLGDGNDKLYQFDTNVGKNAVLYGEAGHDELIMGIDSIIHENLLCFPGAGDDFTWVDDTKVNGSLEVHDTQASFGSNIIIRQTTVNKDINVFTSPYQDYVSVDAIAKNINIDTYNGDDTLQVHSHTQVSQNISIHTGAGDDSVFVLGAVAPSLRLDTGEGNDSILLEDITADRLFTYLGSGNDTFRSSSSTVKQSAHIYGGTGQNTFDDIGGNNITGLNRFDI
jgi:hypothetical protein